MAPNIHTYLKLGFLETEQKFLWNWCIRKYTLEKVEIAREVRKWEQEGRIISKAPQSVNSMMLEIMWVQLQGCPGQGQCQCSLENLYSSTQEGMYISNTSSSSSKSSLPTNRRWCYLLEQKHWKSVCMKMVKNLRGYRQNTNSICCKLTRVSRQDCK